jgi:hypothetical protein
MKRFNRYRISGVSAFQSRLKPLLLGLLGKQRYNRVMDWLMFITNIINRVPLERVLFPPRDNTKALEEFVTSVSGTQSPKEASISEKPTSSITKPPPRPELPTPEETAAELKRRLGKELYRAELDLSNKLRIAGKPCDCLESKHTLGLEAAAEELIAQEPGNPVYTEILQWIKNNHPKVTIEAIVSGQYDNEYSRMASEFKGFRKRIMGTTSLTAMIEPKEPVTQEPPDADLPGDSMRQRAQELANRVHAGELSRSEAVAMLADDIAKEETR